MYKQKLVSLFLFLMMGLSHLNAQAPFHKGVNLSNWFQNSSAKQIQFSKFGKQDLQNIKDLGCDVVRLPIPMHDMTLGAPTYTIDPLLFSFLDQVADWAEELKIYLIIDNHSFDPIAATDASVQTILLKVWQQMAAHYKNRSEYIIYEILNEPHGITTSVWGGIQKAAIDMIRTVDTKHLIVVGASNYNSIPELPLLPVYTDKNLLYTFHFYDPFLFTHQGASWNSPPFESLTGVPFPGVAGTTIPCPANLKGTWVENALKTYGTDGSLESLQTALNVAIKFKTDRNINLYCGEFGVYMQNANPAERVAWYGLMKANFAAASIPWTSWDYQGGFGLFNKGSDEQFKYDINEALVSALGLTAPPHQVYVPSPEKASIPVYQEYIESGIQDKSSANGGTIDFYKELNPKFGKYSISWSGSNQYAQVCFDFKPNKDLSQLAKMDYAVLFWLKCDKADTRFKVRFLDTKTGTNDHPWRMDYTVDQSVVAMDGKWHLVYLPLKDFVEGGSYDGGNFYNQQGLFDWTAVDGLSFVNEFASLSGTTIELDQVMITNDKLLSVENLKKPEVDSAAYYDPTNKCIRLTKLSTENSVQVIDLSGRIVYSNKNINDTLVIDASSWQKGCYLVKITQNNKMKAVRVIVE